jgi:PRTRC genetic system ThiF family protein
VPKRKTQMPQLDLSFARAATLMMPATDRWRFILVGCGGTGSWLAPSVARIASVIQEQGKEVMTWFIDPDHVEAKNIPRQNFCHAELGLNKAATLAARFSAAWGVGITAMGEGINAAAFRPDHQAVTIWIGCVDNAKARQALSKALTLNRTQEVFRDWWLDCGNTESAGQVLFGSCAEKKQLNGAFVGSKICKALPGPAMVAPDLLKVRPEEKTANKLSCAEIQLANAQSLAVNQQVAAIASDYLVRITHGGLRKFATYFDLESGSARSRYITQEEISR